MKLNIELEQLKKERMEAMKKLNKLMRSGGYLKAVEMEQLDFRISTLSARISDIEQVLKFEIDQRQNTHLMSWLGKTLSLVINNADLSVYYMNTAQAYFKTQGLMPKNEMFTAMENVKTSLSALRNEFGKLLDGDKGANFEDFDKLEQLITKSIFTDRELIYKKQYDK